MSESESFSRAFSWILQEEGVDADDPDDRGGRTRYGIAQRFHPDVDVEHLTLEGAREIYLERYWAPIHGDELPEPLALAVFDAAVQHDPRDATRFLQQSLRGLKVDGLLGPATLAAAQRAGRTRSRLLLVLNRFLAARAAYYGDQVALRPVQRKFLATWLSRLFRLHERALALP